MFNSTDWTPSDALRVVVASDAAMALLDLDPAVAQDPVFAQADVPRIVAHLRAVIAPETRDWANQTADLLPEPIDAPRVVVASDAAMALLDLDPAVAQDPVFAQLFGGPSLFGGLSGVLYGLLGYVWIYQLMAPNPMYHLPRGVLVMMLVWLALCMSGLVSMIGFGQIANAAHVGGLLIGCLAGLLGGLWARRKQM